MRLLEKSISESLRGSGATEAISKMGLLRPSGARNDSFLIYDLGLLEYSLAWEFQKRKFLEVKNSSSESALILCRHYPVITLGRQAKRENIKASGAELAEKGVEVYEIERGGDVTYHGPGQLTLYPVFNLIHLKKDIHRFLRKLEELTVDFLSDFGIRGEVRPGLTGVWVEKQKIASIGIAIKHWITFHGLSINIKQADLANFGLIRPCGMDIGMTSLESLLGRNIEIEELKENLIRKFQEAFFPKKEEARL